MKKIIKILTIKNIYIYIYSKIKLQHNLDMKDLIEFLINFFQGEINQTIEVLTNVKSSFYTWFFYRFL